MDDEDLRDLFAGLAMQGLIHHFDFDRFRQDPQRVARWAYDAADAMIDAKYEKRNEEPEVGIAAVKKRKTKEQL
jgi:hypothetical protein